MKIQKFLWPRDQARIRYAIDQLPIKMGEWWTITMTPHDPASEEQKGYYWAKVVRQITNTTGNSEGDVHHHLKNQFLPRRPYTFNGQQYEGDPTTKELNKDEWSTYITRCEAWAAQEGYL